MTPARERAARDLFRSLDRVNRILIPRTKEERDRIRDGRLLKLVRWLVLRSERFTEDGQVLAGLVVFAALAALDVKRSHAFVAWAIVSAALLASLFVSRYLRLDDVHLDVAVARRVTAGEETTFTLLLRNEGGRDAESIAVRGPLLPWDARWGLRRAVLEHLPARTSELLELRATFDARGTYVVEPFRAQVIAPFGIAHGPAIASEPMRVVVVPAIANVAARAAQGRRHQPGGIPRASRTADSRELLGVRPYRFGDPVRALHARTWARRGEAAVREYREEYFARVAVVLDTDLGRDTEDAFEAAVSVVAGVLHELGRTEAVVDVVVLGTTAHDMTVGRSLGALDHALTLLAAVRPEGAFDGTAVLARVSPRLASLSSVVFVALRWDDARRAFATAVEGAGARLRAVVVTAAASAPTDAVVTAITPEQVRARAPITI